MNITTHAQDCFLTPADEDYIRRRLFFALGTFQANIDTVKGSLVEIPCYESDRIKHFLVEVKLTNGSSVIGDSAESDLYIAIDRAAHQVGLNVASSVDRQPWTFNHFESTGSMKNNRTTAEGFQVSV